MWYEDLTECDYFGKEHVKVLSAIGWLKSKKDFPTGNIPKTIYEKLCELNKNPWSFAVFMGFHECDLCKFQFEFQGEKGSTNLFIPHNRKIYACPELITHYINAHFYCPPREFLGAVFACPPMRSMEYHKKMLENGGREIVELIKKYK